MAWFERTKQGITTQTAHRNETPSGYWIKCKPCGEIMNRRDLVDNSWVCTNCNYHFRMGALEYFNLIFDKDSYKLFDEDLVSGDPLDFVDTKSYPDRIKAAQKKTGMNDAARGALGTVGGHKLSIGAMDFNFVGGSMGSVVGEILTRAIRRGYEEKCPVLIISQSGGARMMEGALSLMQMAKTSANLARLADAKLPFISLMTHPTTGGVTASYAMLGDFNFAEPEALIGFAGPRVIRETIGADLPEGFQRAEFVQDTGFLDDIISRPGLRKKMIHLLGLLNG